MTASTRDENLFPYPSHQVFAGEMATGGGGGDASIGAGGGGVGGTEFYRVLVTGIPAPIKEVHTAKKQTHPICMSVCAVVVY